MLHIFWFQFKKTTPEKKVPRPDVIHVISDSDADATRSKGAVPEASPSTPKSKKNSQDIADSSEILNKVC